MPRVITKTREVYYSPSAGRHFLTKRGAAYREASEMINAKYPPEREHRGDYGQIEVPGFHWSEDEWFQKVHARLMRLILKQMREQDPPALTGEAG